MHFKADSCDKFLEVFLKSAIHIRAQKGCIYLELLQDANDPCCFSTYSHWENEQALENYRHSEPFKSTWAATKILFDQKPEAITWLRPYRFN
jgi:hypothetical protein